MVSQKRKCDRCARLVHESKAVMADDVRDNGQAYWICKKCLEDESRRWQEIGA